MNNKSKNSLPSWLPFVVGAILVAQFAGLGAWQVSRGFEKRATQHAYRDETGFSSWQNGMDVRSFQRLKATGHYDTARQFLLENIIVNSRYGYYVLTPLNVGADQPLLLVNRGWLEKIGNDLDLSKLDASTAEVTVRGRAGSLPRAGMKMGDSIDPASSWPKGAVFPALEDISAALASDVQPFVLLLDHEEPQGYLRNWAPTEFGPGKHFGYAIQWFAMGAVLSGLLIWNYRKKRLV